MKQPYIVLLICLVLLIICIWREVQRENKARLGWRIFAVTVAIAALACIILPVSYQGEISLTEKNQGILLTDGYNKDSLGKHSNSRIFTLDKNIKKANPKAVLLSSVDEIKSIKPAVNQLEVYGYGLSEDELKQLHQLPLNFHPAEASATITAIGWNGKLKTGEPLKVQGLVKNASGDDIKVMLNGLGTTLDSALVSGNGSFDLTTSPKHGGRAVYRLIALKGRDTIENSSIPFEAEAVKPFNVLILASSPDFENKFLKNWLSANSYGVAVRNMISRDKFSQEFANLDQQSLQHLTPAVLDKFDVVVSDLDVLKTLNPAEAGALKQQVLQKGLGVIARADTTLRSSFWLQQNFPVIKVSSQGQVIATLKIQEQNNSHAKLLIDPVYIGYQNYTQPLVTDQQNHIVASSSLAGNGRVVFTTLGNTHNWMLSGDETDYAALWSLLISKAAKHTLTNGDVTVKTPVPNVNGHVQLQVQSASGADVKINQTTTPSVQQPDLPFAYTLDYWPSHAGWQQVQHGNQAQWWFAYPSREWQSLTNAKKISDTKKYAILYPANHDVTKQIQQKVPIEVPKIYFYILLLAACIWLWVEAKFLT